MAYNRWLTPNNPYDCGPSELYHHGVKGMKWGKHLFGKGVDLPQGGGGGGGLLEPEEPDDEEWKEALKKLENGEISREQFKAIEAKRDKAYAEYYKKIQSLPYRLTHNPLEVANDVAVKGIHAAENVKDAVTHPGETASQAIHKGQELVDKFKSKIPRKKATGNTEGKLDPTPTTFTENVITENVISENKIKEKKTKENKLKEKREKETVTRSASDSSLPRSKKRNVTEGTGVKLRGTGTTKKVEAQGESVDDDARARRYGLVQGRDRYRKNGKYRNMNLTDVYGENAKVKDRSGYRGKNLFKDIDVDDIHDGKNYATREVNVGGFKWKSKDNDGRYDLRDKVREKITGAADDDHLISTYKDYVKNYDRRADQTHAWSVGLEEEHIRNQARKHTDNVEQKIYDKSLAGTLKRVTQKKRRRRW